MYIAPNSIIKILTNVPLSTGYADTLYFSSVSAQTSYFSAKVKPNTTLGSLGTFSFTLDDQTMFVHLIIRLRSTSLSIC
mgnify:CR=1 FL=1